MENEMKLRREIAQLRVLAATSTDAVISAQIELLIQELEERMRTLGNGSTSELAPGSVWWPEAIPPPA
jgi:hypothetical protein